MIRIAEFLKFLIFAVVLTIPAAASGYLGSELFEFDFIASASLVYISLSASIALFNFLHGENPNVPQESQQPIAEPDDHAHRCKEQDKQDAHDETDVSEGTERGRDLEQIEKSVGPSNSYGLTKLKTDILDDESDRLNGWLWIHEDGEIELTRKDDLNVYTEMMIYIIAAKFASEEGSRESPVVSGAELGQELINKKSEIWIFINKAKNFLTPTPQTEHADFNSVCQVEFEINIKRLPEAVDWVLGDREMFRDSWDLDFNYSF